MLCAPFRSEKHNSKQNQIDFGVLDTQHLVVGKKVLAWMKKTLPADLGVDVDAVTTKLEELQKARAEKEAVRGWRKTMRLQH